jgi:hypothetical protein
LLEDSDFFETRKRKKHPIMEDFLKLQLCKWLFRQFFQNYGLFLMARANKLALDMSNRRPFRPKKPPSMP